jgi:hypothetical protein
MKEPEKSKETEKGEKEKNVKRLVINDLPGDTVEELLRFVSLHDTKHTSDRTRVRPRRMDCFCPDLTGKIPDSDAAKSQRIQQNPNPWP